MDIYRIKGNYRKKMMDNAAKSELIPQAKKDPAFTWPGKRRKRLQRRLFQWRSPYEDN